ncbi:hypothetical protein ACWGR4_40545 [Embleya sp. NPDC055664]
MSFIRSTRTAIAAVALAVTVAAGGVASAGTAPAPTPAHKTGKPLPAPTTSTAGSNAIGGYQIVTGTGTVPRGTSNPASATCPAGTYAFGGGAYGFLNRMLLTDSTPAPDGSGWNVWVRFDTEPGGSDGGFTVYAVCANGLNRHQVTGAPVRVDTGSSQYAFSPQCPAGMVILGGGVSYSTVGPIAIRASEPHNSRDPDSHVDQWDRWMANVTNLSPSNSFNAQASGVCGSGFERFEVVQGPFVDIEPGVYRSIAVSCPPGMSVLSGGGFESGGLFDSGESTIADSYPTSGSTWVVGFENSYSPQTRHGTAQAVCVK